MNNIIEKQRSLHQEIEILEQAIINQYHDQGKTHRERLLREHQVDHYLNHMVERCNTLSDLYKDTQGIRRRDIDDITGTNDYAGFYKKIKSIRDYHQARQITRALEPKSHQVLEVVGTGEQDLDSLFSGEEGWGKFLDLHSYFDIYLNLIKKWDITYLDYLEKIAHFEDLDKDLKDNKYANYLEGLIEYLEGYFRRAQPLNDYRKIRQEAELAFKESWVKGEIEGWGTPSEVQLYCKACKRAFAKLSVFNAHLSGKKHIKAAQGMDPNDIKEEIQGNVEDDPSFKKAQMEAILKAYFEELEQILLDTMANIERKQALTEREREIDQEEPVEEIEESSDSEDDARIYNPLKLPLGWDGKPIPYWLYKLHGLGVEYPCEICGNFVYMGRKAFERHFQEWRHAHGMRCLGIPNTKHFNEITSIEDAYSLWEQLKENARKEISTNETLEEFEDDQGNVYNKKTYEDLKRQGII